jgi:hypothetical protein
MEISSEVYDHYRATDAEVLFHLPEYLALKEVYATERDSSVI